MTILIAARNAAATIERALQSCWYERAARFVLIDDHCTDDTVARARNVAGSRMTVVRAPSPGGVGAARQAGLDAVETEFAAWLDADDEWVNGRVARLGGLLRAGHDVACEAIELYDGPTGQARERLDVPAFLRRPRAAVRLFERNYLPGDTQVAFRTAAFREAGGYDPAICGPESYDLLLRVLRRGGRFAFGDEAGYRMHAYPDSVSRDVDRQRAALAVSLAKHHYADVRTMYRAAGYSDRVTAWALVFVALHRGNPRAALSFLDEASPASADPAQVLEPEGPCPMPEGWRRAFQRGTCFLLIGGRDRDAEIELDKAEKIAPTPESANNLGVALARLGRQREADCCFTAAVARFPEYRDAAINTAGAAAEQITVLPLRRAPSRRDYAVRPAARRDAAAVPHR